MAAMSDRLSGAMAFKALQPLDGGFADLVMTPRRPAAQLAPLHRVDHRTLARSPIRDQLHRRLQPFVTSMTAPVASGWSGCRVGLAPTGKRCRTHGAHVERTLRIAAVAAGGKRSTALNAIERLPHAVQSRPSARQAQRSAEVIDELFSHWQARNSVWVVVLQWNPRGLVLHSTGCGVRRQGRAKAFRSSRQFLIS
jgi:hypothetical protein